ncbi:MAG TPA: S41 family peptidase, partial [Pyrinomonadaceae bacterium]|nr:S41 family peptidase [Pyrinomonadaceae bacterium]
PHWINMDFEEGATGQVPNGWASPTAPTFAAELTEEKPKSGKHCVLLHSLVTTSDGPPFGNVMQAVDATPFRGHRVRYRAAVRTEAGSRAYLWMRVDRRNNQPGFFDNMQNRPITSGEWQYYEITGDVDQEAAVISIGMILIPSGKAWLDDASFEDVGKLVVLAEPPRALTSRGLENLVAFTRLLGYVRHFHPSDQAAATDWGPFTIAALKNVEAATDATDLARKLESVFKPVAPTVMVFVNGSKPQLPAALAPPANDASVHIISWKHKGFGQKGSREDIYRSERVTSEVTQEKSPDNSPNPRKPFFADLGGGVSCLVPLALFADAGGTLPHVASESATSAPSLIRYSGNDRTTRLADIALAWNIFEHFYPYFDVVKTDWLGELRTALTESATDRDETAFVTTLRRMVAKLQDGHGGVFDPGESFEFTYPVIFGWIEDRLVITAVAAGAEGLRPGDAVLKIDGRTSNQALAEAEEISSGATPQWRRYIAMDRLLNQNSEMTLEVQTQAGETKSVKLKRNVAFDKINETRPPKITELKTGIFYLDLDRVKDGDFKPMLAQLEKARGIIFDLRGYPRLSPDLISHLIDKPVESARWMVPMVKIPDHANMVDYNTDGRWKLEPVAPRFTAKVAFLTDGRAISYAESLLGIIEAYKLADIVGEPSAGTNGDINPFSLPGNYIVRWTGMKVLKHDGSRHHGVGIQPTVLVHRTIRGIAEGRDEQLERALAIVSQ